MLRPPRLPFILLAVSCLFFLTRPAAAQPAWDLAEDDNGGSAGVSASSQSSDEESPPDVPRVAPQPRSAPAAGPAWSGGDSEEALIDAKLAKVDEGLKGLQAPLWAYTIGWSVLQAGLAGYFAYDATLREHERALRASDIMRATISGLNTILTLIKPMPARGAYSKFKAMPEGTLNEKQLKVDYGVRMIGAQIGADRHNARPEEHVVAALVGIGFGAGLLFGYDEGNIRPAVETTLGIILLAELQFATRPWRSKRLNRELAMMGKNPPPPPVDMAFAPLVTQHSRGISVVGRF